MLHKEKVGMISLKRRNTNAAQRKGEADFCICIHYSLSLDEITAMSLNVMLFLFFVFFLPTHIKNKYDVDGTTDFHNFNLCFISWETMYAGIFTELPHTERMMPRSIFFYNGDTPYVCKAVLRC